MKYTREELLERLAQAHSWKEARVSVQDVYEVVSQMALDNTKRVPESQRGVVQELKEKLEKQNEIVSHFDENVQREVKLATKEYEDTITQLNEKIKRLSDTNKQLRSENKALRSSR